MEENKIFCLLWRFNAVVIAGAGLLAIAVLGFTALSILRDVTRERQVGSIVNIDEESEIEEELQFGELREIGGTPYLLLPLSSYQSYDRPSYTKSTESTRNFLFFDSETGEQNWLFPHYDYLIVSDRHLVESSPNPQTQPVLAILYSLVQKDSDGDKRLSPRDRLTVALSQPNGGEYREILTDVEKILGHQLLDRETLIIFYQSEDHARVAKISLKDFTAIEQTQLPLTGAK
ncbi:MAG: hypothetical protein J7647_16610 [Cyanobacteria bacterium SBLK]|nr:hypothetical protein [Cyanobacteria bacterium SBLK]